METTTANNYGNAIDRTFTPLSISDIDNRSLDSIPSEAKKVIFILNRILNYVSKPKSIIVSGETMSGKSFIIEQLGAHLDELPSVYDERSIIRISSPNYLAAINDELGVEVLDEFLTDYESDIQFDSSDKKIFYIDNVDVAIDVHRKCPHVSMILELNHHETSMLIMKDRSIISDFEIVDMDDFDLTWSSFLKEMKMVNTIKFEHHYPTHISDDMVEEFVKDIFRMGYADSESKKVPKKNDNVGIPIGVCIDLLEFLHAQLLEKPELDVNSKTMRALTKEVFEDHPISIGEPIYINSNEDIAELFGSPDEDEDKPDAAHKKNLKTSYKYKNILDLPQRLKKHVINQDAAIDSICDAIKIDAAMLRKKDRPIASFIFQGPSGVGKTELAKSLAEELFTKPAHFIRLDMSEYSEEYNVSRLFGSAPGLIGSDEGGALTNEVLEYPQSVVLLDEAEKAHPKVWNAFLQVFDSGRMTDGKGVTVNFSNCVFIMTTNLGNADTLKTRSGFGAANMLEDTQQNDKIAVFKKAMDKYFPTEFINRLDGICLFNTLDRKAFKDIIDLQMKSLAKITHDNHPNYTLDTDLDDTTINWILDKSESKRFGAREVQRVIRKEIVIKMADFFITNAQKNTTIHDIISIRYDDKTDGIIFDINTKE